MAPPRANAPLYHERILSAVVDFLMLSGMPIDEIRNLSDSVLSKAKSKSMTKRATRRPARVGIESVPAAVLNRWHRDRKLLDVEANPVALKLFGSAPSLEALVKDEEPKGSAKTIVAEMKALGLVRIRARHRYVPTSRVATIPSLHPVLIEHVAHSLLRLLETVERNVNSSNKKDSLIERFTHITDLPIREVQAFTEFSQQHGSAFLASVEDWFDSRRATLKQTKRCSAGIHVIAYVEQPTS